MGLRLGEVGGGEGACEECRVWWWMVGCEWERRVVVVNCERRSGLVRAIVEVRCEVTQQRERVSAAADNEDAIVLGRVLHQPAVTIV